MYKVFDIIYIAANFAEIVHCFLMQAKITIKLILHNIFDKELLTINSVKYLECVE